jgi:hypothetical protein
VLGSSMTLHQGELGMVRHESCGATDVLANDLRVQPAYCGEFAFDADGDLQRAESEMLIILWPCARHERYVPYARASPK